MREPKHHIKIEAENLKLIPSPKKELRVLASKISAEETYAKVFPKDSPLDIIYISLVSYTIGHINKNDCLIMPDEGLATYKTGVKKPLDIEHERREIVGVCVNAYLTNIKNNKILSEDAAQEILDAQGLVNVGNVFAVWRLNNPEVADVIQENFDENSDNFGRLKASFEYYFNDYSFFISNGTADYPDGELVSSSEDNTDAEAMSKALKTNGGNGKWKGNRISIVPHNGFIGGNALTLNPANEFSDLTAKKDDDTLVVQLEQEASTQPTEKSVIIDIGDNNMPNPKVETNLEVVATPAVVDASIPLSVDSDVARAMQSQLDLKIKELGTKDEELTNLKASVESLTKALEESKQECQKASEMAQKVQTQLDKEVESRNLAESKEKERVQLEVVASRLSKISEFIAIDETNKAMLEKECALASEDDFVKKLEFYKSISKKVTANEIPAPANPEEVKAAVQEVVADTAKDTKSVNIIAAAPSDSLQEKFAKAFNVKTLGFNDKRLA